MVILIFFTCKIIYPMGTRYPPATRRVRAWVQNFTRGYGYGLEILPEPFVLAGGYLLYPTRTRPIAIPSGFLEELL